MTEKKKITENNEICCVGTMANEDGFVEKTNRLTASKTGRRANNTISLILTSTEKTALAQL